MQIDITIADYLNSQHGADIEDLMTCYAMDPMGGGEPLSPYAKANLVTQLAALPNAFSVLAYVDNIPAGLINCFDGFSTFQCKPLVNIHDVIVAHQFRGLGLSQQLMAKVEEIAQQKGCCKITLEVLQGNKAAQKAYEKYGFKAYELDPVMGQALFWQKLI